MLPSLPLAASGIPASVHLASFDWAIYAPVIMGIGFLATQKPTTSKSYFLAGHCLRWRMIEASLLEANISAKTLFGLWWQQLRHRCMKTL